MEKQISLSERKNGEVWKDLFLPKMPWRAKASGQIGEFRTKRQAHEWLDRARKLGLL